MSTRSLNSKLEKIREEFDAVFFPDNEEEQLEADAYLIMAKFLSAAQQEADKKGLKRKELAEKVGTSASYLTQLFRGHKLMNLQMAARLQKALDMKFRIGLEGRDRFATITNTDSISSYLDQWYERENEGDYFKITRSSLSDMPDLKIGSLPRNLETMAV